MNKKEIKKKEKEKERKKKKKKKKKKRKESARGCDSRAGLVIVVMWLYLGAWLGELVGSSDGTSQASDAQVKG